MRVYTTTPDIIVRDPLTMQAIPKEGLDIGTVPTAVHWNYWVRRQQEGVIELRPDKKAPKPE